MDTPIPDGTRRRYGTTDKPRGKDGVVTVYGDTPLTMFAKNWRTGEEMRHTAKREKTFSPEEKRAFAQRVEAEKAQREADQQTKYAEIAQKAQRIWNAATPATVEHPYLIRKQVPPCGLRVDTYGNLVVPVMDESNHMTSLQFIRPDENQKKRFLSNSKTAGGFYHIPAKDKSADGPLHIVEGFATGASIHEATGHAVLVAFSTSNLQSVALLAQDKYPGRTIILCADNDLKPDTDANPGIEAATRAATVTNALLAVCPLLDGHKADFNDLHVAQGLAAVKTVIEAATTPPLIIHQAIEVPPPPPEAPLPLRKPSQAQEEYPLEALGEFSKAVTVIAQHVGAPLSMVANAVLGALSLCAQDIADVSHEGRSTPLSLFFLSVMGSGDRKSSVVKPVREYESHLYAQHKEDMRHWHIENHAYETAKKNISKGKDFAAIKDELAELGDAPQKPVSPCKIVSNVNIEGLYRLFQEGCASLGLISDEAGVFLGGTGVAAENRLKTISNLSSLWSSGSADKVRMGEGASRIQGKRLTVHLMAQPTVVEPFLSDTIMQEQGFFSRFLIVWPQSLKGTRLKGESPPHNIYEHNAVNTLFARCTALLETESIVDDNGNATFRALTLSAEAEHIYRKLYNATEKEQAEHGALAHVSNYASRCGEQSLRIAGVLTLASNPTTQTIDGDTMSRAALLALWYLNEAKRIMEESAVKCGHCASRKAFEMATK